MAPLEGIRVLDLATLPGQFCTRLLAALGAEVTKLEPPEGDPVRKLPPFAADTSLTFLNFNHGKKTAPLDALPDLVKDADVLVDDGRYAHLQNPRLIVASITPFGLTGPYRDFRGDDFIAQAMGGLTYIAGEPGRPPVAAPLNQADHLAGLHAALGILSALMERDRSGLGQHLDVSIQEAVASMFFIIVRYSGEQEIIERSGARSSIAPNGFFPTSDGHISLSPFSTPLFRLLTAWMADAVLEDKMWDDPRMRRDESDLIDTQVSEFTQRFTSQAFFAEAQKRHIPAAPVNSPADFANDPHIQQRAFFQDIDHPVIGKTKMVGLPFRLHALNESPNDGAKAQLTPSSQSPPSAKRGAADDARGENAVLRAGRVGHSYVGTGLQADQPLKGIRVLDFTRVWAGPMATRLLADYGAEVLKVESRRLPDGRGMGPGVSEAARRDGRIAFAELNRNKRSITLEMSSPEARDLATRLAASCDVVIENSGPGVLERWGLGYDDLRLVRPDLVFVSMPGWGRSGPYQSYISYGPQLMSLSGLAGLWGHPDTPVPARTKLAYPDYSGAAGAALGTLAALQHRGRTGLGQLVEVPQIEALASLMGVAFLDYFVNGEVWQARGNRDPASVPRGIYPCLGEDRWVALTCRAEEEWQGLCRTIGRPELVQDPCFSDQAARSTNHDALDAEITSWTKTQTPHQAMYHLQAAGVPAGAVATGEDLYHDLQLRARGYITAIDNPEAGPLEHPGMTVRLSRTPGAVRSPAPQLGEANAYVFRDLLGLPASEYQTLITAGAIA